MSLPNPSQSVSHKRFHQCVNHKKKLSLRHPLPTIGSFSFFQTSLWLGVDKVLQKLAKSYKSELKHLFQCCILIPRKYPRKTHYTVKSRFPSITLGVLPKIPLYPCMTSKKLQFWLKIVANIYRVHGVISHVCIWNTPKKNDQSK
jgi:hypothetical protein